MRKILLVSLLFLAMALSCGKAPKLKGDPVRPPDNPPDNPGGPKYCEEMVEAKDPNPSELKVNLRLFGAPWCSTCKHDFPEICKGLAADFAATPLRIRGELYVPTGANPVDQPDLQTTIAYRDYEKLPFFAFNDEWPWKTFRAQVQKDRLLPAAVVMDAEGKILRVFKPGPTTFQVPEILSYIKGLIE